MPALVLLLTPSTSLAPAGARIASRISPSVIVSQRQIILPYDGFLAIRALRSSLLMCLKRTGASLSGLKSAFSSAPRAFASSEATYCAIAGAAERPGDSMPATLKKRSFFLLGSMMKSSLSQCALRPAKEVITSLVVRQGTDFLAATRISERAAEVVETSVLSSISNALGPMSKLPSTVGVTSTPLPILDGHWNIVCFASVPTVLSQSIYSPFLGVMLIESSPISFAISSLKTPAAFTTYFAKTVPSSL